METDSKILSLHPERAGERPTEQTHLIEKLPERGIVGDRGASVPGVSRRCCPWLTKGSGRETGSKGLREPFQKKNVGPIIIMAGLSSLSLEIV